MSDMAQVQTELADGLLIARLRGEIDVSNVHDISRSLIEAASNADVGLIADLSAVTYLDSAGIRFLFDLERALRDRRKQMLLVVGNMPTTRRILQICGLDSHIPVYQDIERARASLASD